MICPACGTPNLPGAELCRWCSFSLAAVDRSMPASRLDGHLLSDAVAGVGSKAAEAVSENATLGEAVARMVGRSVGALLVTDAAGTLVGILTERDFLTRVAGASDFARRPVRDYMTRDPETVDAAAPLALAMAKMDLGGYRHLPVTDGGRPVGMLSVRDVIQHVLKLCKDGE